MWSHELYVSGKHSRVRCPSTVLRIRKDISHYDIALLQKQYASAIQLDLNGLPASATLAQTHPFDLWDSQKGLFLDPGAGLNIYCEIKVSIPGSPRPFRPLVACSTMTVPTCVIWTDQDPGWHDVLHFLSQAKEVTDYAAVDFLARDLIPKKKRSLKESIGDISTGHHVKFSVTLVPAVVENSDGFLLQVFG